jgi:type IV pilus assembly protein PilB
MVNTKSAQQDEVTQPLSPSDVQTAPAASGLVEKAKEFLSNRAKANAIQPQVVPQANEPSVKGMTNLLDALYVKGMITEQDLKGLKFEAITVNKSAEELLSNRGAIDEDDVQRVRAEMRGIGFVDLSSLNIPQTILQKIPSDIAKQNFAIAFDEDQLTLKVGMIDPLDLQKIQFLESISGKRIDAYFASRQDVDQIINSRYGAEITREVDQALASVTQVYEVDANKTQDVGENSEDAPVIKIVNLVLDYAAKHGASDIHIEPRESRIAVRYRVNGVMSEKLTIPRKLAAPVITRIKILGNMKIDEHRIPQDGRFQIKVESRLIDLRVSVVPTVYGEKVVMRLLEKGGGVMTLEDTGLSGISFERFRPHLDKTQGMILVTGPTGSGKTQTLASCLKIINKEDVNAMTLEDPVEIRIEGVNQVQVNAEVGLTFANGLRSFLRQDPDIIMVGEIRDTETAKLAVQASLTGHLVLATLHTNDAAGSLPRLIDMGVESYLLASTINVVVAQRLVRKLDKETMEAYTTSNEVARKIHEILDPLGQIKLQTPQGEVTFGANTNQPITLYRPKKTPQNETGFAGRIGIFEVLTVTDEIRDMITAGESAMAIRSKAVKNGMISMVQDGFIKALQGLTTLEEVLRVIN